MYGVISTHWAYILAHVLIVVFFVSWLV